MHVPLRTLQRAAEVLDDVADVDRPERLAEVVLPGLARLVGGDLLTYCEIGPGARIECRDYPSGALDPAVLAAAIPHFGEHPIIAYYRTTTSSDPVKISDFLSAREFHRLSVYEAIYRSSGLEDQIAFQLPSPQGRVDAFALCRSRRDFTETDRAVLGVLAGPLSRAVMRAHRRQRAGTALAAADRGLPEHVDLTGREIEILELAAAGRTNQAIASALAVSPRTVAKHLEQAYRKLGVTSRAAAVHRAAGYAAPLSSPSPRSS